MNIYNTLTRQIEPFKTYEEGMVKMYTCGPTVYHFAHIGNLRTYIMEDVLEKTLKLLGYKVNRVMNLTDVGHLTSDSDTGEDKMVKGAKREHTTVEEIAERYAQAFYQDMKELNNQLPEVVTKATSHIDEYIKIITKLIEKGYAYQAGGNVYFDVSKVKDYYVLTNHKEDEMVVGVRSGVEEDNNKKNQADFALWFTKSKFEDQDQKWDSPWGVGYPGWHIECSGISLAYLGEHLDIHCGGVDNIFPHHTNEIAQSEAYLGHPWCNYWFHAEHLNDQTGKMSKSKGEFLTLSLLKEKGYNPLVYRFFCLSSHYRKTLVFSYDAMEQVTTAYQKLKNRILRLTDDGEILEDQVRHYENCFKDALADDLNTANALTILYDVLKDGELNDRSKKEIVNWMDQVLSLDLLKKEELSNDKKAYIEFELKKRDEAKANKDYALADQIREKLALIGVTIKDSREGTTYDWN